MNVQYLSKAMLDYSETSENVYLTFNQHIELKNKKFEILVHLTFKESTTAGATKAAVTEKVWGECVSVV